MTSDAKIGLLLGLVFIIAIAFLINGLPGMLKENTGEEPQNSAVIDDTPGPDSIAIADRADRVTRSIRTAVNPPQPAVSQTPQTPTTPEQNTPETEQQSSGESLKEAFAPVRSTMSLPPKTITITEDDLIKPDKIDTAINQALAQADTSKTGSRIIPVPDPVAPKTETYTVQPGDSLASIAKKMYGPEIGNKKDTVKKLYKENSKILKSPDHIVVGQKLKIPQLISAHPLETDSSSLLAKVRSITKNGLTTLKNTVTPDPQPRAYTVKSGDTLWKIAEKQLGNGERYHEIVDLNSDRIDSADQVYEGMNIKIPAK